MKKILLAAGILTATIAQAQVNPNASLMSGTRMTTATTQNMFQDRRNAYFFEDQYMIDGRRVLGTPFLYREWEKGVITTVDGRVFNGYKLKYDAFNQTVFFSNGTDSLEVNEEIREFNITVVYPDTVTKSTFINAAQYGKVKKPAYYELLADGTAGQLLKLNRKVVEEMSKGIPAYEGRKVFELQSTFFYYNKATKKLVQLKANGTNVTEALGLDAAAESQHNIKSVNFGVDAELTEFFQRYLAAGK